MNCFKLRSLYEGYLKEKWIAVSTDGASVMLGKHSGVVSRLKQMYPDLFTWH
jgi:hypothetical protein